MQHNISNYTSPAHLQAVIVQEHQLFLVNVEEYLCITKVGHESPVLLSA